jgi:hypothetical protein
MGGAFRGPFNVIINSAPQRIGRVTVQCGTQYTEEFAAFGLTARGMSCSEAIAAVKTVEVELPGYAFPPGYECSSKPASRGVEETTCTSGGHSFSWFLREP